MDIEWIRSRAPELKYSLVPKNLLTLAMAELKKQTALADIWIADSFSTGQVRPKTGDLQFLEMIITMIGSDGHRKKTKADQSPIQLGKSGIYRQTMVHRPA